MADEHHGSTPAAWTAVTSSWSPSASAPSGSWSTTGWSSGSGSRWSSSAGRGQGHAGHGHGRRADMSVLDEIIAGVRVDLAERQAGVSLDELKEMADRQDPALDPMPRLPRRRHLGDRRGQAVQPEPRRCSPTISDPAALAARLRGRRRGDDQRAHRAAPVRRQPGRPAGGPRRRLGPGAAQGLHRHVVPAVGGPRGRRRPGSAHRRGARRQRARPGWSTAPARSA